MPMGYLWIYVDQFRCCARHNACNQESSGRAELQPVNDFCRREGMAGKSSSGSPCSAVAPAWEVGPGPGKISQNLCSLPQNLVRFFAQIAMYLKRTRSRIRRQELTKKLTGRVEMLHQALTFFSSKTPSKNYRQAHNLHSRLTAGPPTHTTPRKKQNKIYPQAPKLWDHLWSGPCSPPT